MKKCKRCNIDITNRVDYQLVDGSFICPYCAVVGEELMPDEQGDLQVTSFGREANCMCFSKQITLAEAFAYMLGHPTNIQKN